MVKISALPALSLALLVAGCGGESAPADDNLAASGEVLEGTISDDMLPLDDLRSQPPLVEPASTPQGGSSPAGSAAAAAAAADAVADGGSVNENGPAETEDEDQP